MKVDNIEKVVVVGAEMMMEFGLLQEEPSSIESRIESFLSQGLAHAVHGRNSVAEAIPDTPDLKRDLSKSYLLGVMSSRPMTQGIIAGINAVKEPAW